MSSESKVCAKCLVEKSADHFGKANDRKDGLQSYCKVCTKNWHQGHRENRRLASRKWDQSHRQQRRSINASYRKSPVGKLNGAKNSRDRYARISQVGGCFTVQEWLQLVAKHKYCCLGCGRPEGEVKLSPDHIVPIKKMGRNDIGNIQPLCIEINGSRIGNCQDKKGTKIIVFHKDDDCSLEQHYAQEAT